MPGAARSKADAGQILEIEGRGVRVSNLDKIFYPRTGFTKGQMIDYYIRASEYILPHLKQRPVTLKRYPDGITGQTFYEKDAPRYTPEWVTTYPVPRRTGGRDIRYVLVNDLPTLVWCANIATLEFHPFLHRAPKIETPTDLVFDLDPGEGFGILNCAEVAFILRELLDELGLKCFPKVSGSKGIQVYAPLNTPVTYDRTRAFALEAAQLLERQHHNLIVSEMAKAVRKQRVFIDWSQNSDFKTTVGVYSMRAKREQPFISMPVTWDELDKALTDRDARPFDFSPEAALERLNKIGDLFAPVLALRQTLPAGLVTAVEGQPRRAAREGSAAVEKRAVDLKALPKSELEFVEPMQALLVGHLPEGDGWQYEIKLDGYRALAIKTKTGARLLSRRNNDFAAKFASVAKACETLEEGTMLDGEIVALDAQGRPSFHLLQNYESGRHMLAYYVFDLLAYRRKSLLKVPLRERRAMLDLTLKNAAEPIRVLGVLEAAPADLVAAAKAQGIEGFVAKRSNGVYEPGERTGSWVKFKVNKGQELVIGGYMPGQSGFESLLVGYYEADKLMFMGKVKNGFVVRTRQDLARRFKGLETETCPFANLPEPKGARRGEAITATVMKKCRWLKPELVAQIEYTDWTEGNHLRHSRYAGIREDKDAREVRREVAE